MADEAINQEDNQTEQELTIENVIEKVKGFAKKCGGKEVDDYVFRTNTSDDAFNKGGAYFGFIEPSEQASGVYHDLSLVFFPPRDLTKKWIVSLGVGSEGFINDLELASFPGVRRLFSKLVSTENGFCKTDFTDIGNSTINRFIRNENLDESLKKSLKKYQDVLQVGELVDINQDKKLKVFERYVAAYAKLRDWASNNNHRSDINKSIGLLGTVNVNEEAEIEHLEHLLENRKYVVLQGPPGTGKTRMAKKVAKKMNASVKFIQFHAETSYSDFIYGIRPNVKSDNLNYTEKKGIFVEAIEEAQNAIKEAQNKKVKEYKKVVLIIDEINRANLSNVLGPIFYLFEYQMDESNIKIEITPIEIEITPNLKLTKLPENLYVIATMNTADRSLAVLDFALRRRFAWYDVKPKRIKLNDKIFYDGDFERFASIFEWYANSNELALQPGHAYFIADDEAKMKNRIRYELYPLIKEYLNEGLLTKAKEEFNQYFLERIQMSLFE